MNKVEVAGKEVKFFHTAVNKDMYMSIDGYHNPDVCPECIQPGILVESDTTVDREDLENYIRDSMFMLVEYGADNPEVARDALKITTLNELYDVMDSVDMFVKDRGQ